MLKAIIDFSLKQRLLVVAMVMLTAGAGFWSLKNLPIDAFPDLTNNQVNVVTEVPGLAPSEVEQLVTYPLESAMMGIADTREIRSVSKFGLSLITIVFEDSIDIYFARQQVNERLQEARSRIPDSLEPTLGPLATAFGEIFQYVVEGDGLTAMELKTIHDWDIRHQLRTVPGVNEVNSWGGFVRQYQVVAAPDRLLAYDLSLSDIFQALADNNTNFGGSFIEQGAEAYTIRGLGRFRSEEDIGRVVVKATGGVPVLIEDIASIEIGPAVRQGAVSKDGKGEVVSGMVIMTKGQNSKAVIERVKERLAQIEASLPSGVRVTPFYDQTALVNRTSRTVATNLIEGGILVVVVLFLFLRHVPSALIVASVIPLSMLIAFIGMKFFGVSANLMSLGAIDFGIIVDGSVVMVENFRRKLEDSDHVDSSARPLIQVIREGAVEVARPILYGISIIVSVYIPIFALRGMSARMFHPMALTVCCAIIGSLILALTLVPALASLTKAGKKRGGHRVPFAGTRKVYERILDATQRHRVMTVGLAVLVMVAAIVSIPFMGTQFMPELDEGALLIETFRLPSVSLSESVRIGTWVERTVIEYPEVETVVTKYGRPDLATEAMGIYQGDVYVILKPYDEWERFRTKQELIEALSRDLQEVPGVAFSFTQPLAMRLDEVISGVRSDVAVKLFGDDPVRLEETAESIRRVLSRIRGAADVQIEVMGGAGELLIEVDRVEMARYGLSVEDVRVVIETALGGRVATQVVDGRRRFDVVVRLPDSHRRDQQALEALRVPTAGGERVALGRIARISTAEGPEVINRENAQRRLVIQSNVRGRDIGTFVAEARQRIEQGVTLPSGYYITWGGEFENQQEAMARLFIVVPLAVMLIFLILFTFFGDLALAVLLMSNLPFALVGGVAALWTRGLHLSLSAAIGFVALFGVATLNGVVLVGYINALREQGRELADAVRNGASVRLRPVLMTALVASLGFLPMATSTAPGAEVQRPLATVVIGGLVTSTLMTLLVLPTLYSWCEGARERRALRRAEALARALSVGA